jgi:transposase-like protein
MTRGRPAMGPELVSGLEGSESAKKRLRVILETLTDHKGVEEACAELSIGRSAFNKIRERVLQGALEDLEPKPPGRPAQEISPEQSRLEQLERDIEQLQRSLQIAHVREELLLAMPHLVRLARKVEETKKKPLEATWWSKKKPRKHPGRKARRRR